MLRILCLASLLSVVLGVATEGLNEGWMEGGSIFVAVIVIVLLTSVNSYLQEREFLKLNELSAHIVSKVKRNG